MLPLTKPLSSSRASKEGEDVSASSEVFCWTSIKCAEKGGPNVSEYINQVSGLDSQDDRDLPDHTYSRPSVWRPRNHHVKPCRYLFSSARREVCSSRDDTIDVETVADEPALPLPSQHGERAADELGSRPDDCDEDGSSWEDTISKIGWSPVQTRILPKMMHIMEDVRLCCLAYKGRPDEEFLVENSFNDGASKLSYLLSSVGWDRNVIQWVHSLLVKHLMPVEMDIYLTVLNLVKKKFPALVDKVLTTVHVGRGTPVKDKPIEVLLKAVPAKSSLSDQVAEVLLDDKFEKLPHDPIFVVIPNSLESSKTDRFSTFVLQLRQMASVSVVGYPTHNRTASIGHSLDQMVAETRTQLADVRSKSAGRPVILVGWNVGAAIACLASQLESVQGVVCLGYPFKTVDCNSRQSNLSIVDVNCPVLFVVGARSETASQEDLEDMRLQMRVLNQLVVVGACNGQFIMSHKERAKLCVTQSMVDRSLVIEIYNFVGQLLTQPPLPPPRPAPTACVPTIIKHFPVTSYRKKIKEPCIPVQQLSNKPAVTFVVNGRGRRATVGTPNSLPKRKPRAPPTPKLILFNSAKYMSLLPHHNYAAKFQFQPLSINNERSVPPH